MSSTVAKAKSAKARINSRLGRSDRSAAGLWFWEIDRVLLLLVAILLSIGLIAVAAGSPATAQRYSGGSVTIAPLLYFWKQLFWVAISVPVMIVVSMMPHLTARRLAMGGAAFFSVFLAAAPLIGMEVNGATRWIDVGIGQFQPSEFLKPFYIVTLAWFLSLRTQDPDLPVFTLSGLVTAVLCALLMMQPDFGQTLILVSIWMAMVMLAGLPGRTIGMLAGGGIGLVLLAYFTYPTATTRINNFLFASGDTYQVDMAHATLSGGGFIGLGPGGGEQKFRLPEAHTDYIFSVIGEEFGLIACIAIACVFLAIVVRVFLRLLDEEDGFVILAAGGLAFEIVVQAMINMAVNTGIAPSKGMTLPFISYGGSSMLALCITWGLLLAFTRKNPYLGRSPYVVKWRDK
jgi:cell division protein FtsW